ncbi:hypothetical protein DSAG12_04060 [Promethearchaeum syntrophicum]|uniref:Uncharacterized protein n=1 Tax=Promethearchaeum syntrophicum TaxID=2594042 RepID=A0AC61ZTW2_9ARCH|nr:hypothetical protein [Candidatus Prometheoarchaeum syntrophicum]
MKYERDQYVEGFSYFSLLIAGAYLFWGFSKVVEGFYWNLISIGMGIIILMG